MLSLCISLLHSISSQFLKVPSWFWNTSIFRNFSAQWCLIWWNLDSLYINSRGLIKYKVYFSGICFCEFLSQINQYFAVFTCKLWFLWYSWSATSYNYCKYLMMLLVDQEITKIDFVMLCGPADYIYILLWNLYWNVFWVFFLNVMGGLLDSETSGAVRKAGGNFKEKLRELGGLDAVFEVTMNCHSDLEVWACMLVHM